MINVSDTNFEESNRQYWNGAIDEAIDIVSTFEIVGLEFHVGVRNCLIRLLEEKKK